METAFWGTVVAALNSKLETGEKRQQSTGGDSSTSKQSRGNVVALATADKIKSL